MKKSALISKSLASLGVFALAGCASIVSKSEYPVLLEILNKRGAQTEIEDRKLLAERAFGVSSHYDTAIHNWFAK